MTYQTLWNVGKGLGALIALTVIVYGVQGKQYTSVTRRRGGGGQAQYGVQDF